MQKDRARALGYVLEPLSIKVSGSLPCLASFRAIMGVDNYISIHQKGLVSFFTGSRSAQTTDSARKSITAVFVAADESPFFATVREKGRVFNVRFGNAGLLEKISQDRGKEVDSTAREKAAGNGKVKNTDISDPINVLKLRLAKGEITKDEYDELRKVIE